MGDIKTTELDKQAAVIKSGRSATVQEFLDWLLDEYEPSLELCARSDDANDTLYSVNIKRETLMYDFFDIDPKKLEEERQALLGGLL